MYKPFKHRPRSPSPSLSSSSIIAAARHRISDNSGFPLVVTAVVAVLFLLSLFSHPDPNLQRTFQYPALFPSTPLASHSNPNSDSTPLLQLLSLTQTSFLQHCPSHLVEPVYPLSSHTLTSSQTKRYDHLRSTLSKGYMLVSTTRQISDSLPDLLSTIIILTSFLGPHRIYLSILEGPSDDCTPFILSQVLLPILLELGVPKDNIKINIDEPKINWETVNRIEVIADLRNKALQPLWTRGWGEDIESIVFFNDVYLHASDVLELLHQHQKSDAGISTAMDWWKKRPEYYYDIWVGRTIDTGDLFYPIDQPSWSPSSNLFPNSPSSKKSYDALQPFQVYSSWNALAVLDPRAFTKRGIKFRRSDSHQGECAASECSLVAVDFWKVGLGRVQVVPSVQLAYERDVAMDIIEDLNKQKIELGWKDGVPTKKDRSIDWIERPPKKVRCHPWPEVFGLSANVWENTLWVDP